MTKSALRISFEYRYPDLMRMEFRRAGAKILRNDGKEDNGCLDEKRRID